MPNSPTTSKNPILAFFALLIIGPFKLSWLMRKQAYTRVLSAYSVPYEVIAIAFSVIAARSGSSGFDLLTFCLSELWGFPLLWLVFGKPLTTLWEKSANRVHDFASEHIGKPLESIAKAVATVPGTAWLWQKSGSGSWFVGLVDVVVIASLALGSLYTGWLAKSWIEPHLWNLIVGFTENGIVHTVVTFLSYGLALTVAMFVGNVTISTATAADDKGRGLLASVFLAALSYSHIASWTATFDDPALTYAATGLAAAVFYLVAYPLLVCIASNGLFKTLYKVLSPIIEAFFWEPSANETKVTQAFRDLFQQSTNVAIAVYVGLQSFALLTGFGLNGWLVGAATVFMTLFSFCLGGVVLNVRWGNGFCNAILSALVGWLTFTHTGFLNPHFGQFAAIVFGVGAGVVSFAILIPLLYAGVKKVLSLPVLDVITTLGSGLRIAHSYINEHTFDPIYRASLIIYHECYRSDTPSERSYERVVLHLTNIVIGVTLGTFAYLGLTAFATSWLVVSLPLSAVVFVLSYSLLGQLVVRAQAQLSGALTGVFAATAAAAYLTPNHVFDWQYSLPVAGILGVLVFAVGYPLFYQLVRRIAGDALCSLEKPLDNRLNAATRVIGEPLLKGWHMLVVGWTTLMSVFDGLFGRKSK